MEIFLKLLSNPKKLVFFQLGSKNGKLSRICLKSIIWRCSSGHLKCSSGVSSENSWKSEKVHNFNLFPNYFPPKRFFGHKENSFYIHAVIVCSKSKNFAFKVKKKSKIEEFFLDFLELFIWTFRLQFHQPCRKILLKVRKVFVESLNKNMTNLAFFLNKFFSPKMFFWDVECSFDSPADFILLKSGKFSLKVCKNYIFSRFFPKFFLWTRRMYFWEHQSKKFSS